MKTIQNILLLALIAIGTMSLAQSGTGEIKGVVIDQETGETIIGANVSVTYAGNLIGDASDISGKFNIKPLRPGTYIMTTTFTGMDTSRITLIIKSGQIAFRDTIFMTTGVNVLGGVVIDGGYVDPLINPYEVSKPTVRREQLKNIPSLRSPAALLVQLGEGSFSNGGGEDGEIYFRGSRSNGVVTYLDGMKVVGTVPTFPAAAISSFSVYTGGLPAKYGDTSGGVIEIETRSYFDMYNERMAQLGIVYE